MAQSVYSFTVIGIDGQVVRIETELLHGISSVSIIGLGDQAIKEAKERIEAAISNSYFDFPQYKVIINLAPGDMKKSGSSFDLGMAVGLLMASNQLKIIDKNIKRIGFIGELSLDGQIRPSNGVLPMVLKAREEGFKTIILSRENVLEARLIDGIEIVGMDTLKNCVEYLKGKSVSITDLELKESHEVAKEQPDFYDVKG
ncbi:MAG: magnesium chelatase domain-containing protein, partial [Bacillota bacterium]|nr:magnesium chelatase domain-containing protein [Bacillota bacterium]